MITNNGLMLDKPLVSDPLTEPQAAPRARLEIIDKLRGLVIVLMVLDHVRDFFSRSPISPTDLAHTTAALFATRWITHLCAPTFVALAGVAVFLQSERGKRGAPLMRFLLTRGLWLIALEVTWVSFGFGFDEPFILLQVIWAIGVSFILLAPCTLLPPTTVLAIGLAIVCGHDLFAHVEAQSFGRFGIAWTLMMAPGRIAHGYVAYPALPWFGIMACGYGAGRLFLLEPGRRDRILVGLGLAMLATFVLLRGLDGYGDPAHWSRGPDTTRTILAFLNVTKYPPSLCYTLVTLGLVLTFAPAIAPHRRRLRRDDPDLRPGAAVRLPHPPLHRALRRGALQAGNGRGAADDFRCPSRCRARRGEDGGRPARRLPRLGLRHPRAVAARYLVRAAQGAPARLVARLPVSGARAAVGFCRLTSGMASRTFSTCIAVSEERFVNPIHCRRLKGLADQPGIVSRRKRKLVRRRLAKQLGLLHRQGE